ncbi:MAG TPA: hypothetical protein DEB39_03050 [Planctomycetaceae bacterium]|nr:hypothetical protein [Planctomycetaceae bacterium]
MCDTHPASASKYVIAMRSRSFFFSLFLGNLLLVAAVLGIGAWWTFYEMDRQSNRNSRRFQGQLLALARDGLEDTWPESEKSIGQYCRSYSNHPEFRLTVVDHDGRVLGDSEYPAGQMKPHNNEDHPEFLEALAGNASESIRQSQTKKIRYRYVAAPILHKNQVVAAVRVAVPVSDLKEDRRHLLSGIATCFVLMLLAVVVFFAFLSWFWSKPLKIISQTARQIAEGNLGPIPEVSGSSEMIELHDAIDQMRQTVSIQLNTIIWQRERLQSVLHHLPDAVFALDSQDRVVYYNESAENLFRLEPFTVTTSIQFLLRFPSLLDFYFMHRDTNSGNGEPRHTMLEIRQDGVRNVFEAELVDTSNHHDDEDIACLLIVNDLTDAIRTERMKTDFVANTSHELRTPLTSIRMTLDNALDGVYTPDAHREVFEMLDRSVHRLESLTDDLLALHSVEETTTANCRDNTTLREQKHWLEELFASKAGERNVAFTVELPENADRHFLVDNKRLGLVVQNLVDNALKFTPSCGKVGLRFSFEGENVLAIRCEDTGCGISPEDQNRVFERFYCVKRDKSDRQRGTGLGLAIVKHAVERLDGSLILNSQPGVGSVFLVRIPIVVPDAD